MDIWRIKGGRRLDGACFVQGSKNAPLPIIAASLVVPAGSELLNVPQLRDVDAALRIVRHLGCTAEQRGGDVYIDSTQLSYCAIPHDLMEEMRSSVIFLGALLARCGEARLSLPGGCQLGNRPIDLHLAALRSLGAEIEDNGREIYCHAAELRGAEIVLPFPSVGATENILMAAALARGIGSQKLPEGAAISLPLRQEGSSRGRAFLLGTLSGSVEPIFGILVVLVAAGVRPLMPWLLSFAAGAMLYVVVEELVPQAHSKAGTCGFVGGFLIMMILDVALG